MKRYVSLVLISSVLTGTAIAQTKPAAPAKPTTAATPATKPVAPAPPAPDKCVAKILAERRALELNPNPPKSEQTAAEVAYLAYDQGQFLTALSLAEEAASHGDAQAHTLVARIHDDGLGVPKDPITAARWYARAAELCDVPAMFAYGVMLAEGRGVGKDRVQAAEMLEKAAISGHALANYNLGLIFLRGDGKPENAYRAAQHIHYAAEKGVAAAQYDIASMYLAGAGGLPQDAVEASSWMSKSAIAGYTAAQYDYAVMLLKGLGLNQHRPFAVDYLKAAADKGVPGAQNRLANMYKDGAGVEKNMVEAIKWRTISKGNNVVDDALDAELAKASKPDAQAGSKAASDWDDLRKAGRFE